MTGPAPQGQPANPARSQPFRYAMIDLASARDLVPLVESLPSPTATSLFGAGQSRAVQRVGPWLIRLSQAPEIETAIGRQHAHVAWGYIVHSTFDPVSIRQSLRHFNIVHLEPDRRTVLFRYWDPRVMRMFLDVATPGQRARLFNLIERIDIGSDRFTARGASPGLVTA